MTQVQQDFKKFKQEVYRQGMSPEKADGVLEVLPAKGIPVTDAIREQIRGCTDLDTLQRWMIRTVSAATAEDVLRAA